MASIITNGTADDDLELALVANDRSAAIYNQGVLQQAFANGGYIAIVDGGTYHIIADNFTYPANTTAFVVPGVQFAINGNTVTLASIAPILSQPSASALVTTWAARPSAVTYAQRVLYVSDVGLGGSYWFSDGTKWRPVGGRVTLRNITSNITHNTNVKTVLASATLPAGLFADGDILEIAYNKTRTGGTSDTDATDLMIGTSPTVLGTSTGLVTSALATTTVQIAPRVEMQKRSATSVLPTSILGVTGWGGQTSALSAATVPNMDTQTTFLQITAALSTGAGEVVNLQMFHVTLVAGS